jgi:hypothetical protein
MRRARSSIAWVAIVTADRPAYLSRCLNSVIRHLDDWGRSVPILVVDDSRNPVNRTAVERATAEARRTSHDVRYLGVQARRLARKRAIAAGCPPAIARWLLPEPGATGYAGAARNHALLASAGRPVLMLDDDTACLVWPADGADDELALVGHEDPRETRHFGSRIDAIEAVTPGGVDLVAAHESLLGRRLIDLVSRWRGHVHIDEACDELAITIATRRSASRVRATFAGVAGDAGTSCPYPALFTTGRTRRRLAKNQAALRQALTSREVVRVARRWTVCHEPWLMGCCAAFDNAEMLPPFVPIGRNEDGLFAAILQICDPGALIGHVPCGVVHDSPRGSQYDSRAPRSAVEIRLADVIMWLGRLWAASSDAHGVETRMEALGRRFSTLGSLPDAAFRRELSETVSRGRGEFLAAVEGVLERRFRYPPWWRDAIRSYLVQARAHRTARELIIPVEYADRRSIGEAAAALQADLGAFGRSLIEWPAVWAAFR